VKYDQNVSFTLYCIVFGYCHADAVSQTKFLSYNKDFWAQRKLDAVEREKARLVDRI